MTYSPASTADSPHNDWPLTRYIATLMLPSEIVLNRIQ
jgi:hypothetical protein